MTARATMHFPPDFLWGTATAAHQVEGHNHNNDWWAWEQATGRIRGGHRSGQACDWWANAEADFDRAAAMGQNTLRLSVEWSRIEPEPSAFDRASLDRYRQMLEGLHRRGMQPMVTLHHFTNPLWLVDKGDFSSELMVDYFRRFVARVAADLGDLIPFWVTINEPMVYGFFRYLAGAFPAPRERGWWPLRRALRNMLRCHAAAYEVIKAAHPQAQVGLAKHVLALAAPPGRLGMNAAWTRFLNWLFNDMLLDSLTTGRLAWPLGRGSLPGLAGSLDFIGLNYYGRYQLRFPGLPEIGSGVGAPEAETQGGETPPGDEGRYGETFPAGLFQTLRRVRRLGKPVFITENGLADGDDSRRPAYLITHLRELWRAVSFSYPIMGYYHWSLVDNFEWDMGWTQRFGLIAVDPTTQARTLRPSGALYGEICRQNSLSSAMVERYAAELMPTLFPG